jgi:acetyltransferase-like isoleucine patch superfamily enzyme
MRQYCWQELVTALVGWLPGLPGIASRAVAYKLILKIEGFAAVESGVRIHFARNVHLGRGVYLDHDVYLHACPQGIEIGADSYVMHHTSLHVHNFRDLPHAYIRIGRRCYIGEYTIVRGQGGVTIGDAVLIGPGARLLAVEHHFGDLTAPVMDQGISAVGIEIGSGAWIGAGATVLDGMRIGEGAVVGAGAVVTRDVPPHCVAVGSPARVIRECGDGDMQGGRVGERALPDCFAWNGRRR